MQPFSFFSYIFIDFYWDIEINTNFLKSTVIWPQKNRDVMPNSQYVYKEPLEGLLTSWWKAWSASAQILNRPEMQGLL